MTKEKLGEQIGLGSEKIVYQDRNNPNKVIGVFEEWEKKTPNQMKGMFYLTKILHLLLPKNIPDMYWAGSESRAYQSTKVEHDDRHKVLNSYVSSGKDTISREEVGESIEADSAVGQLQKELEKLGIRSLDYAAVNYSSDSEGNILYLDTFYVWKKRNDGGLKLFCDFNKLEDALEVLSEEDKHKAKKYLSRLKELYEQELKQTH